MARLAITKPTLKRLFSHCRNQCAFPGCNEIIYDTEGTLFADICHIEAANEGGERFNPKMDDEERRDFSNLIILCKKHHTVTNNVEQYPVSKMKEMKDNHEIGAIADKEKIETGLLNKVLDNVEKIGQANIVQGNVSSITQNQTINFYADTKEEERFLGIITELFKHILSIQTSGDEESIFRDSERLPHIKKKNKLNFPPEQQPAIRRMLVNTVHFRSIIETFLNSSSLTNRAGVLSLQEIIQQEYCKKLDVYDTNTMVGDVEVLQSLASELVPSSRSQASEYQLGSLALVLHFFDICDIGLTLENAATDTEVGE